MSEKKPKLPTIVSPVGTLFYPWLGRPDDKFDPNKPVYKTGLLLDANAPAVQTLLTKLDELADAAFEQAIEQAKSAAKTPKALKEVKEIKRAAPYKPEEDDNGEETGRILTRFKMNAKYTDKKTNKTIELRPDVFNAANKKLDATKTQISGGTRAQLAFQAVPYCSASNKEAGISLRMIGVRVIELVSGGARDGASLFGAAVEGYASEETFGGDDDAPASGTASDSDREEDF